MNLNNPVTDNRLIFFFGNSTYQHLFPIQIWQDLLKRGHTPLFVTGKDASSTYDPVDLLRINIMPVETENRVVISKVIGCITTHKLAKRISNYVKRYPNGDAVLLDLSDMEFDQTESNWQTNLIADLNALQQRFGIPFFIFWNERVMAKDQANCTNLISVDSTTHVSVYLMGIVDSLIRITDYPGNPTAVVVNQLKKTHGTLNDFIKDGMVIPLTIKLDDVKSTTTPTSVAEYQGKPAISVENPDYNVSGKFTFVFGRIDKQVADEVTFNCLNQLMNGVNKPFCVLSSSTLAYRIHQQNSQISAISGVINYRVVTKLTRNYLVQIFKECSGQKNNVIVLDLAGMDLTHFKNSAGWQYKFIDTLRTLIWEYNISLVLFWDYEAVKHLEGGYPGDLPVTTPVSVVTLVPSDFLKFNVNTIYNYFQDGNKIRFKCLKSANTLTNTGRKTMKQEKIMIQSTVFNQPMQPLIKELNGTIRFKENKIVRYLLDNGNLDLNDLARVLFPTEDQEQFAQLIGYSLNGYSELSYVTDASYEKAAAQAKNLDIEDNALSEPTKEDWEQKIIPYSILVGETFNQQKQALNSWLNETIDIIMNLMTPTIESGKQNLSIRLREYVEKPSSKPEIYERKDCYDVPMLPKGVDLMNAVSKLQNGFVKAGYTLEVSTPTQESATLPKHVFLNFLFKD